jgi:hypothetical protein
MYKNKYFKSLLYRNKLHEKDMLLYQATFQDFSALIQNNKIQQVLAELLFLFSNWKVYYQ